MAINIRLACVALGLLLIAGCADETGTIHRITVRYGPLEIEVQPFSLIRSGLVAVGITHYAYFSNYEKLIDSCGPGIEKVEEMYERRIADMIDPDEIRRTYRKTVGPVVQESMARCLEERPALVPKECKRKMIVISSKLWEVSGTVGLQCGEPFALPLEVKVARLDAADPLRQSWRGPRFEMGQLDTEQLREEPTHIGHYSNLDKLLDECGPGAKKARDIAIQEDFLKRSDVFTRIIDEALIECLKKRDLVPSECLDEMVPVLYPFIRSFSSRVGFRCGSLAE